MHSCRACVNILLAFPQPDCFVYLLAHLSRQPLKMAVSAVKVCYIDYSQLLLLYATSQGNILLIAFAHFVLVRIAYMYLYLYFYGLQNACHA